MREKKIKMAYRIKTCFVFFVLESYMKGVLYYIKK